MKEYIVYECLTYAKVSGFWYYDLYTAFRYKSTDMKRGLERALKRRKLMRKSYRVLKYYHNTSYIDVIGHMDKPIFRVVAA